jgi:alkanesulfonate monooxygenase SsuD/methylene tetrahydromethanopterin reductase-like flavin-dependent oxidoreductase (luciferase family)
MVPEVVPCVRSARLGRDPAPEFEDDLVPRTTALSEGGLEMRYAIDIPNFGDFGDPRLVAEIARDAEAAGWDGMWVWDHVQRDAGVPYADPWVLLTAIAISTSRLRFGPMITPLPRRRPWLVAREAVTLDVLSGGRFVLGAGLGNPSREFTAFGEEADLRVRAAKLDEGLAIVDGLFRGLPFSFEGEYYRLRDVEFLPVPVQQPRVPIWLAATWPTRAPFRRAARWDGVWPIRRAPDGNGILLSPEDVRAISRLIAEERAAAGLPAGHRAGPYDILVAGITPFDDPARAAATAHEFAEAGATWWNERINATARGSQFEMRRRIDAGPPRFQPPP